jgi:hypothetical protein
LFLIGQADHLARTAPPSAMIAFNLFTDASHDNAGLA